MQRLKGFLQEELLEGRQMVPSSARLLLLAMEITPGMVCVCWKWGGEQLVGRVQLSEQGINQVLLPHSFPYWWCQSPTLSPEFWFCLFHILCHSEVFISLIFQIHACFFHGNQTAHFLHKSTQPPQKPCQNPIAEQPHPFCVPEVFISAHNTVARGNLSLHLGEAVLFIKWSCSESCFEANE